MTAMDELVAFVRQQLDRIQAHAEKDLSVLDQATNGGAWNAHYGHNLPYSEIWADGGIAFRIDTPRHQGDAMAIARMMKLARQRATERLAEVEAKRRILDEHPHLTWEGCCGRCIYGEMRIGGRQGWPCTTVRLLAQPYAGQPGWRPEWATEQR